MSKAPLPGTYPLWRQLHVRAALIAVPLLVFLGMTMFVLLRHTSAQTAQESSQRMNLGLARYIVEHQAPGLIDASGQPARARMKEMALHAMMMNPFVEVYLLDAEGRVLAHALEDLQGTDPVGRQVDLAPIRLLDDSAKPENIRLPVVGTDPRNDQRLNIFSVARLSPGTDRSGYLYVVLNGNSAQAVASNLSNSAAVRDMALGLTVSTLLAAAVLVLVWTHLTRPLRNLTDEMKSFRGNDQAGFASLASDDIGVLRSAMHAMQRRIAQQFQHLEDSDRQRRELISNISHDLRTPLSNVQGYVETVLLRGEQLDASLRAEHLRTALRHADLLGRRIGDLFELSMLDVGRMQPNHEVFCLAELLQDVVQNYQLGARHRGVVLQLAAGSYTKANVLADIAMIERVLQNLIDNALRCTSTGGDITLAIQSQGPYLEISVSDTGCGIAKENLPHIFERYWCATDAGQQDAPTTSSGLGLAIVKRILDLHGSAVRVHSEFNRGTRFEFLLPQAV